MDIDWAAYMSGGFLDDTDVEGEGDVTVEVSATSTE